MHVRNSAKAIKFFKLFILFSVVLSVAGCSSLPVEHKTVRAKDGEIRIPVSGVNDGKVHLFTYKKAGKRINFFVRTDGRGELSTFFDACFTCHKFKKGYRQEGIDIVCNECGMKFRLADEQWDNKDGCSPIVLKSIIADGHIIIKTEHIEKGAKLF
jgi:uncharacterized membrane protein